uniref:BPI fold-containing family B member 4-like n=1 Tax=Geotrypetes seraphini TaxID=260995 RepID=A0A6P8SHU8_GEOSA|nr:BPI fold-containing family B member 4-like [Geotrypetes seraphini]
MMFRAWRLVLISCLLAVPQGVHGAKAVIRVSQDKINEDVTNSMNGGTAQAGGGGLLGGLLGGGGGGLLGGLLGGGGESGGLLGGLLGGGNGGGLLGNLLGGGNGGGLLGGILGGGGGGGLLGGLLGDGGGGGLLGSLLGGGGGHEGGGGAGGGLLGGLLGGGGNGGLLGGILGEGGVLGILGNGGVLETVQGITGLKILDLTLPKVVLKLVPGIGVYVNVYTKVEIDGKSILGPLDIAVEVNITATARLTQEKSGIPRLVIEDCNTLLGGIKIKLLDGLLSNIVNGLLGNVLSNILPGALCPLVTIVLDLVDGLLITVDSIMPLELIGSIQYTVSALPIVSGKFIELDVNTVVRGVAGNLINYHMGGETSISMPPMKETSSVQLGLSTEFLECVLAAMHKENLLDVDIKDGDITSLPPLNTAILAGLIPGVSKMFPDSLPLILRITTSTPPTVTLQKDQGIVTMVTKAEILVSMPDSSTRSICSLKAIIVLDAAFSMVNERLKIEVSLDSTKVSLMSSEVGDINTSILQQLVQTIAKAGLVTSINSKEHFLLSVYETDHEFSAISGISENSTTF